LENKTSPIFHPNAKSLQNHNKCRKNWRNKKNNQTASFGKQNKPNFPPERKKFAKCKLNAEKTGVAKKITKRQVL